MKKYIIFDMDGTLIESESSNFPLMFKHLQSYIPELEWDYFVYYCTQTAGTPLHEQLEVIFKNTLDEDTLNKITGELYDIIKNNSENNPFFEGVLDMVKKLNSDYTLFLSTGNSDEYAQKKLSEWWIAVCFDRIMWSSIIGKWPEHIKLFKDLTQDEDFEKYCVYIWDGNTDREIAQMSGIDFIKVWKAWIDKYEVDYTVEAEEIIQKL